MEVKPVSIFSATNGLIWDMTFVIPAIITNIVSEITTGFTS